MGRGCTGRGGATPCPAANPCPAAPPPLPCCCSKGAARYLHLAIPALWSCGIYEVLKRYLMSQG